MEFRNLCKQIGAEKITRLIESVTEESFKRKPRGIEFRECHEALKIILNDGFSANPSCPMMIWYNNIEQYNVTNKKVLHEEANHKIYAATGDIFRNNECEVTALFQYPNVATSTFNTDMAKFLGCYSFSDNKEGLKETGIMPTKNVKAIYYSKTDQTSMEFGKVNKVIADALSLLSSKGYKSVAMNGVKTLGFSLSELDNLKIIINWFRQNPNSSINTIHLVDKNGGFNKLSKKTIIKFLNKETN
ncbi:MAG: hypothetical protein IK100_11875 [Muribaculaceae bacterium]|nr:hypothetical protein [Muribaculaceae bacterium]